MAAGHSQNAIFTPIPPSSYVEGPGHQPDSSPGSIASPSALTAPNAASGRQAGISMSNFRLLGNFRRPIASVVSNRLRLHCFCPQQEQSSARIRAQSMRIWQYARLGFTAALLCWVVYCTARYFIAVQKYREDHVRSQYALGMGITSAFTIVFFASETYITFRFSNNQFHPRFRIVIHSLAYLSSALVLSLSIINLVLVNVWRTPHNLTQFGRSIAGRCYWDLDVVWSSKGMACTQGNAIPFGDWLGAAVIRLVISAAFIIPYHISVHGYPANYHVQQTSTAIDTDMGELADSQPRIPAMRPLLSRSHVRHSSLVPIAITVSEDEHQRRSLSFTAAGQVLSRIEGSEYYEDDYESSTSSSDQHQRLEELVHPRNSDRDTSIPRMSHSPRALSPVEYPLDSDMSSYISQPRPSMDPSLESGESASSSPPSTYFRSITPPSNDLQNFASAFRDLVSQFTRETREGLTLDTSPGTLRHSVRVLGSNISRMSTIDSMSTHEAGSQVRTPSSFGPPLSNSPVSRKINGDWVTSTRGYGQDEFFIPPSPSGSDSRKFHKDSTASSSRSHGQDGPLTLPSPSGSGSADAQSRS